MSHPFAEQKPTVARLTLPIVMDFQGSLTRGVTAEITMEGFSVVSDIPAIEGSFVSIQFCLATEFAYMNLSGLVSSVKEANQPLHCWALAIRFVELGDPERTILTSCLQEFGRPPTKGTSQRAEPESDSPPAILSLFVTDNPHLLRYRPRARGPEAAGPLLASHYAEPFAAERQTKNSCEPVSLRHPWRTFMQVVRLFAQFGRDLLIHLLPELAARKLAPAVSFAFIAHPRDLSDVCRKVPWAHLFPDSLVALWLRYQWPVIGSYITGLKTVEGKPILGAMLFSPLTTQQMLEHPRLARKRVYETTRFAEKLGARIVGLGAFTSIVTKDGLDLLGKVQTGITTGNAHSAAIAVQNVLAAAALTNLSLPNCTVAIAGAAGSVGSACAKMLARLVSKLILIDIKKRELENILQQLKDEGAELKGTSRLDSVTEADVIIAATNSQHTLVTAEHLKPGAIVVDAAQPKNVSELVPRLRSDVLVIDSAIIETPGIDCHFDLGLAKGEVLGCLSESMVLAATGWQGHYSLGKADPKQAAEIVKMGRSLGFHLAYFRNSHGYIKEEDLVRVAQARTTALVRV